MGYTPYKNSREKRPFEVRFFEKVEKDAATGCWNWVGAVGDRGYGYFSRGNGTSRSIVAHRASYLHFKGPIPDGLFVLHGCDNRRCVNPDHLHVGTSAQNSREMVERKRSTFGERHPGAQLTEDMIPLIRDLADDGIPHPVIAAMAGVGRAAIGQIARRESWRHVGERA